MKILRDLIEYRELMITLAWKNIAIRYKQAYMGIAWAVLKPITLMLNFTLRKCFFGVIGCNDAGKSTLLKYLADFCAPTQGSNSAKGKVPLLYRSAPSVTIVSLLSQQALEPIPMATSIKSA